MVDADTPRFVAMLRDVFGLYPSAKALTEGQVAMFFRALGRYTLAQVSVGLDAHVKDPQRGRFPPLPADVIAQLDGQAADDGRPGPEEAWAISLAARDESETVVWTAEAAQAMSVARPVLAAGDEIGARMAFREAYGRLVELARRQRNPTEWIVSEGWDAQRRASAVAAAVEAGRLPHSALQALTHTRATLAGLLEGPASGDNAEARKRLRELAEAIRLRPDPESSDAAARRITQELKAASAQRVSDYERQRQAMRAELDLSEEGEDQA